MKVERGTAHTVYPYWTVQVDAGELVTDSGKPLTYPTWIGVLSPNKTPSVWAPAASKPRDYTPAAKRMLEKAYNEMCKYDWPQTLVVTYGA